MDGNALATMLAPINRIIFKPCHWNPALRYSNYRLQSKGFNCLKMLGFPLREKSSLFQDIHPYNFEEESLRTLTKFEE